VTGALGIALFHISLAWTFMGQTTAPLPAVDVIAAIQVHGNQVATDAEVVAISGLAIGGPFTARTSDEVTRRLEASKRFERVTVLKRFASIDDPTRIVIVIVVEEGPVRIVLGAKPGDPVRVVKRGLVRDFMYLPILDWEDGYGTTFGVAVAKVGVTAPLGRLSFPLTWGGMKRAGATFDRPFTAGPFTRIELGAAVERQTNPAFDEDDSRRRLWARGERVMGHWRAGTTWSWQHVSFAGAQDTLRSAAADITFDTRVDPILPRNAVVATASLERIDFSSGGATDRLSVDARGYVGLIGSTVLAVRATRADADRVLPPYLQSLLGGWQSLRGFSAGAFVGDTLTAGSVELRVPLTSPVHVGQVGVSVFVDEGTAYLKGQRLADAAWHTGSGGSVWLAATVLQLGVSVARTNGRGMRVNVGGGFTF
jgi:outer membrane protein assembly factor BamA